MSVRSVRGVCNKDAFLGASNRRYLDIKGKQGSIVAPSAHIHWPKSVLPTLVVMQLRDPNDLGFP